VKWRPDSEHAYLWYRAVIKTINWDYFICEFKHNDVVNRDIFERDTIRLANPNPTNRISDFFIAEVDIPDDLHDFCYVNTHCHDELKKAIQAINVEFGNGRLRVMTSYDLSKKVDIIADLHIKQLYEKMLLSFKLNQAQEQLKRRKGGAMTQTLAVTADHMRLIKSAVNLTKAQKLDGIVDITIDDVKSSITVYGDDEDAIQRARDLFELKEKNYIVPRAVVSRIIGQKGRQIQEIIDRSNIAKVRFPSDDETTSILKMSRTEITKNAIIILIGTKEALSDAVTLMDYLVGSLSELQAMSERQKRLDSKLNKLKHSKSTNQLNSSGYSSADSTTSSTSTTRTTTTRRGRRGGRRGSRRECPSARSSSDESSEQRNYQNESTSPLDTSTEPERIEKVEQWLNRVDEEENEDDVVFDWADEPCPADIVRADSPHPHRSPISSISADSSMETTPQKRTRRGSKQHQKHSSSSFADMAKQKSRADIEHEYRLEQQRRLNEAVQPPKMIVTVRGGRKWK
jgi:hypothetical protein